MNTKSSEGVNIHEQRRCLDKLDEEIEKTIQELDSLNTHTISQAKVVQKKTAGTKPHIPNSPFPINVKDSPNTSFVESIGRNDSTNLLRSSNQEYLQLSPENLIPKGDPLKEMGYSSAEEDSPFVSRENLNYQRSDSVKKMSSQGTSFVLVMNESKQQKSQNSPSRSKTPVESKGCSRENTLGSSGPTRDSLNPSNTRKSIQNMLEFHKLSNLDIPKEKIHGNSKPEHFFGYHHNLRRQSSNLGQKSPMSSKVIDRLLQYGRDKEERLKARMEGKEVGKKASAPKPPKVRLSNSFVIQSDEKNLNESGVIVNKPGDVQVGNEDENMGFARNFYAVFEKRASLQPTEITQSQLNQLIGKEGESRPAGQKDKSDPFYELYREGYLEDSNENTLGVESNKKVMSLNQSKTGLSSNKYVNVESRYLNSTKDNSKSPQKKPVIEEIKPSFRPQLSKKSLEIAAKLGSSFQRLVDTSINKTRENKKKLLKEMDNELTFKPKINKTSEQLDEQFKANVFNGDELHRWDQLYLMKDKYNINKEMRKLERDREEKNNEECTFHPQLNPNSSRIYRDTSTEFADRATAWKEMREKKLNKEREVIMDKEMEDCTFQPIIHPSPTRLGTSRSAINLMDLSQMSIKGLDQHFEKIDKANKMKKDLQTIKDKFTGKTWKRQITVPKEFKFHKRGESLRDYARQRSSSTLDISTEEKINKNVLFLEKEGDTSYQMIRPKESCNESWMSKNYDYSIACDNFSDAVVKLHYELQKMEI